MIVLLICIKQIMINTRSRVYAFIYRKLLVEGKRIVDGDKLIYSITLKKAFAYPNTSSYFGSYTDLVNNKNLVVELYEEDNDYESSDINTLIEPYKDKLTSYTYIFETKDSIENSYLIELAKLNRGSEF